MFELDVSPPHHRSLRSRPFRRPNRRFGAAVVSAVAVIAALSAAPATAAETDEVAAERTADVEVMRLDCTARDREVAAIGCRWSVPDDAAGIRLIRVALGSGMGPCDRASHR